MDMALFTHSLRTHISDTDCYGQVYHAQFLDFMEQARSEWLLQSEIDLMELHEAGYLLSVHSVNIQFKRPILLHQLLAIDIDIESYSHTSVTFAQVIRRADRPAGSADWIYATAAIRVVSVNRDTERPTRLPPPIREIIEHAT